MRQAYGGLSCRTGAPADHRNSPRETATMDQKNPVHTESFAELPMVPLRDVVVFPHMIVPFVVGRQPSVRALDAGLAQDKRIFLATQRDAKLDNPGPTEIYSIGVVANILQSLKLPNGNIKVLVEGVDRGRVIEWKEGDGHLRVLVKTMRADLKRDAEVEQEMQKVVQLFEQYVKINPNLPNEAMVSTVNIEDPGKLVDTIAAHFQISVEDKQHLLETINPREGLRRLVDILEAEIDKLQVDRRIQSRVRRQMEKAQKEYYLNEKMKAIQSELGRKDDRTGEADDLGKKIKDAKMPKEAAEKALQELKRLEAMPPVSAEATVSRNYLEWLIAVPWHKKSREIRDIKHAERILSEDHYGLDKIKDRILEYLAVRQLVKDMKGQILCFAGPPGVGKTSLARSIARATGREFVRLSLGGVRDEAEIRGHRRTYIGAFPGQIIQMMKKAGTRNPVFLLDEVDKLSSDFRGDPSSALLEVLDPEQNHSFVDHYMDVEYDLSQVMFIATANVLHSIPPALQDRMEVIRLAGYTLGEKMNIAQKFLVPKQLKSHGLKAEQVRFTDGALQAITEGYTREAGVRNLEREIASTCRKLARKVVQDGGEASFSIDTADVETYLGVPKFRKTRSEERSEVGVATGLAWTEVGGEILSIEVSLLKGRGRLILTGKLGDVMQESAQAAMSYTRRRVGESGDTSDFYRKNDIHVHIPEGAIPKDGPSAGITMATALLSAVTQVPVRKDVAMTGEVTLRGKVLPIGGVKEKLLAAYRAGIFEIIMPRDNARDLEDVPAEVKDALTIHLVDSMDQVLDLALERSAVAAEVARPEAGVPLPPDTAVAPNVEAH